MNMIARTAEDSLRQHADVRSLFETAAGRHLQPEEEARYLELVPGAEDRLDAARGVQAHENLVVRATVRDILALYPFREYHERGPDKCIRDVAYVSVYATQAMLLNDTAWYRDKFLLWMRTMIQAFGFPARDRSLVVDNAHPQITEAADALPDHIASIHDTYARLRAKYAEVLEPAHFALMDVPLQTAVDVLTETH